MPESRQPAISVVMPLFNKEEVVIRAIRSVLVQNFSDYELIVINDGSTDQSAATVDTFSDPRIRLVNQENRGVASARNRGVAEARAELVAFLDADDEWLPEFLTTILRLHSTHFENGVYATSYFIIRGDQPERRAILRGITEGAEFNLIDYFDVATKSDPPICSSAVALCKNLLVEIGGFPLGVIAGEDLLTWARLAVRTDVAYAYAPLVRVYAPDAITDRPPRIPQQPDVVSQGLAGLLETATPTQRNGLKNYIGHWHRMRAVVFLKLNRGKDSRDEIAKVIRYSGISLRLAMFYLLSFLPMSLPSKSYRLMTYFLCWLRSVQSGR